MGKTAKNIDCLIHAGLYEALRRQECFNCDTRDYCHPPALLAGTERQKTDWASFRLVHWETVELRYCSMASGKLE